TLLGKTCTAVQVMTVVVVVAEEVFLAEPLQWAKELFLWLTAGLTILSGLHYAYRTGKLLPAASPKP
ncbi:MAG: hypothetical protein ACRD35_05145, partial [Candidatus Acidiferrales bacterium]